MKSLETDMFTITRGKRTVEIVLNYGSVEDLIGVLKPGTEIKIPERKIKIAGDLDERIESPPVEAPKARKPRAPKAETPAEKPARAPRAVKEPAGADVAKVRAHVTANSGQTAEQIIKAIDMAGATVKGVLAWLKQAGQVTTTGAARGMRYHVAGAQS